MRWMHRVRLYTTNEQEKRLRFMLDVTRELYNALLFQRRDAWSSRRLRIFSKQQYAQITELRKEDARVAAVYRECEDAVLHRLDLAMEGYFRRLKRGEKAGHPRFKPRSRWKLLQFSHGNRALKLDETQKRVRIPGVGTVSLRKGRYIPPFGRAFVVEKNGRWWAIFECERAPEALAPSGKTLGIDRGVRVIAATSEGVLIRNGRFANRHRRVIVGHARAIAALGETDSRGRCINRYDPKRMAAVRRLARAKEREVNARLDALHKAAHRIVASADVVALEALNVRGMTRSARGTSEHPGRNVGAKSGLNRAILDAGFEILRRLISEKAARAVREVIDVDARYSSQTCGRCKHVAAKSRRRRRFLCVRCGWTCHADVAAALEIRRRAQLALMSKSSRARSPLPSRDAA